jgi:hypothetical protein
MADPCLDRECKSPYSAAVKDERQRGRRLQGHVLGELFSIPGLCALVISSHQHEVALVCGLVRKLLLQSAVRQSAATLDCGLSSLVSRLLRIETTRD